MNSTDLVFGAMKSPKRTVQERHRPIAGHLGSAFAWGVFVLFAATALAQQATRQPSVSAPGSDASVTQFSTSAGPIMKSSTQLSRRINRNAEEHFLRGARAFERDELPRAEREFRRAQKLDPGNSRYAVSTEIAKQFEVKQLVERAEREELGRRGTNSLEAFREATSLDPGSPLITQYRNEQRETSSRKSPEIQPDPNAADAPIKLAPENVRQTFHLRTAEWDLIHRVLGAYGIQATIDESVANRIVPFDTADVNFSDAASLLQLATATFFTPLAAQHLLVVADTKQNRARYERQIMETISFPGLSVAELNDMGNIARDVCGIQSTSVHSSLGTITLRTPEAELTALNEAYAELLAGLSQVQLDVHVYEIDRSKEVDAGMILPNSATLFNLRSEVNGILANNSSLVQEIIESGLASAGDWEKIIAILISDGALSGSVFNNPFVVFGGGLTETGVEWNSSALNMLLNSSEVKSLNQIQLSVLDQEEATFRDGERYPVITGTFSSLTGALGTPTNTTPQFQYTDLGLTLKVTPYIEGDTNITLHLNLQLDALAGSTLNGIPVLSNRQYAGVVSVHPGDSALLVSAMSKQDLLELTGIPGLSDIPGFSDATNRQDTADSMELVVLITPHIVRLAHQEGAGPMLLLSQH